MDELTFMGKLNFISKIVIGIIHCYIDENCLKQTQLLEGCMDVFYKLWKSLCVGFSKVNFHKLEKDG